MLSNSSEAVARIVIPEINGSTKETITIHKAYRWELNPNKAQIVSLFQHAGTSRFTYNWGSAQKIEKYKNNKEEKVNYYSLHKELNSIKKSTFPWMYEVSKCVSQIPLQHLDDAFKRFFKGLSKFPKFKKRGINDKFTLTGTIKVFEKRIQLPRLGKIRVKNSTDVFTSNKNKILKATISREADRWYVSVNVETTIEKPKSIQGDTIGIDLGLTSFLTTSDGTKVNAPKPLKKFLNKLRRQSRQFSKKKKSSNNRNKSRLKSSKLHRKIKNIRKDFLHKLSVTLTKTKSKIVIEDLDIKSMLKNKILSRHISDVGWYEFKRQLEYKSKWYGSELVVADKFFVYKGGKCVKCTWTGNPAGFDFHHIRDKDFEITKYMDRRWERLKPDLDKCILLCAICHRIEHSERSSEAFLSAVASLQI